MAEWLTELLSCQVEGNKSEREHHEPVKIFVAADPIDPHVNAIPVVTFRCTVCGQPGNPPKCFHGFGVSQLQIQLHNVRF